MSTTEARLIADASASDTAPGPPPTRRDNRNRDVRAFIHTLERLVPERGQANRAALAALRTGLGRDSGTAFAMYPVIGNHIKGGDVSDSFLSDSDQTWNDAITDVASLFGLHPFPLRARQDDPDAATESTGTTTGRDWRTRSLLAFLPKTGDADRDQAITRRVVALLDCDREGLAVMLRQIIGQVPDGTAIDWFQLTHDVLDWDLLDRPVQKRWARTWWTAPQRSQIEGAEHRMTVDPSDTDPASGTT